jgi:hypothetical protein
VGGLGSYIKVAAYSKKHKLNDLRAQEKNHCSGRLKDEFMVLRLDIIPAFLLIPESIFYKTKKQAGWRYLGAWQAIGDTRERVYIEEKDMDTWLVG